MPPVGGRADDLHVRLRRKLFRDDPPHDERIVHDEHANLLHSAYSLKASSIARAFAAVESSSFCVHQPWSFVTKRWSSTAIRDSSSAEPLVLPPPRSCSARPGRRR